MENWQKKHIRDNLTELQNNTKCTHTVTADLFQHGVLSLEEVQQLAVIGRQQSDIAQAAELYLILPTRTNGYCVLMDILWKENQTGAWNILNDGLRDQHILVDTLQLDAERLLDMNLTVHGKRKRFREIFHDVTCQDLRQLLTCLDLRKQFSKLLKQAVVDLTPDDNLLVERSRHMQRYISNRILLAPEIFRKYCDEVFVFKDVGDRDELVELVAPNDVKYSTNQLSCVQCHIHLDKNEHWETMIKICDRPMHLVSKESDGYVLQCSTKVTDLIQQYCSRPHNQASSCMTEDVFVKQQLFNTVGNGSLLCDLPGMGKTWLMQSIAAKLRNHVRGTNSLVFYIQLSSFSEHRVKAETTAEDTEPLRCTLEYILKSKEAASLINEIAKLDKLRLHLVLDGFDEIPAKLVARITSDLIKLSKYSHVNLIISSRPQTRDQLENSLNSMSLNILPFSQEEQVKAIVGEWLQKYPNGDVEKLENFAHQCVLSTKMIQNEDTREILGVPLKCYILAVANEKLVEFVLDPTKPSNISDVATVTSVYNLYNNFVETSFQRITDGIGRNTEIDQIKMLHTFTALELLFPEIAIKYAITKSFKSSKYVEDQAVHVGILSFDKNRKPTFVHRTFAEYFAGNVFADLWTTKDFTKANEAKFIDVAGFYFFRTVLRTDPEKLNIKIDNLLVNKTEKIDVENEKEVVQFTYKSVLWFMENAMRKIGTKHVTLPGVARFEQIITRRFLRFRKRNEFRCFLKKCAYVRLLASVEQKFTHIMGLIVSMIDKFTDKDSRAEPINQPISYSLSKRAVICSQLLALMILPVLIFAFAYNTMPKFDWRIAVIQASGFFVLQLPIYCVYSACKRLYKPTLSIYTENEPVADEKSVVLLLNRVARSDCPEMISSLFQLFDNKKINYLREFCENLPCDFVLPLEAAISTNNVELCEDFLQSINKDTPCDRLITRCLLAKPMNVNELNKRVLIYNKILQRLNNNRLSESSCAFREYISRLSKHNHINLLLLRRFAVRYSLSLYFLPRCYKCALLKESLDWNIDNDVKVIELLLLLFCKETPVLCRLLHSLYSDSKRIEEFQANNLLKCLDLTEARNTISGLNIDRNYTFGINSLETLQLFSGIRKSFKKCNVLKMDYLHFAARHGKIDWIKYLIKTGHNVNSKNCNGKPPLHYGLWIKPVETTSILTDNGANIYAVCNRKRNVAHQFLYIYQQYTEKIPLHWVDYTIEKGYTDLWGMPDNNNITPLQRFSEIMGESHPKTIQLMSHVKYRNDCFVNIRRALTQYSDEKLITVLQRQSENLSEETNLLNAMAGDTGDNFPMQTKKVTSVIAKEVLQQSLLHVFNPKLILSHVESVETLKTLIEICPNIEDYSSIKYGYLHHAVYNGKVEWVNFLIEAGFNADQSYDSGPTPLLCLSTKNTLDVTRELVNNGARIYAVNASKENVIHCLLKICGTKSELIPQDWLNYIVHVGGCNLWYMKDNQENTPFDLLLARLLPWHHNLAIALDSKILLFVFNDNFRSNYHNFTKRKFDFSVLKNVVLTHNYTLVHLAFEEKVKLLTSAIYKGNDEQLSHLLCLLFPNESAECNVSIENSSQEDQQAGQEEDTHHYQFDVSEILRLINITQARKALEAANLVSLSTFENITDLQTLKVLLSICSDFKLCNNDKFTYMHVAANKGLIKWVKYLAEMGHDVTERDIHGCTPLHYISTLNPVEVARALLTNGADINAVNDEQQNIEYMLLKEYKPENVGVLVDWVTYVLEQQFEQIWTMRDNHHYQTKSSLFIVLQALGLDNQTKAKIYSQLLENERAAYMSSSSFHEKQLSLKFALKYYDDKKIVAELLRLFGYRVDLGDSHHKTYPQSEDGILQHFGVDENNYKCTEILDQLNLTEVSKTFSGLDLSHVNFVNTRSIVTLELLTTLCPDFTKHNDHGSNYLHYATSHGRIEWIRLLIGIGYDVHQRDINGCTPLLCISTINSLEATRLLVKAGSDLRAVDNRGENVVQKLKTQFDQLQLELPYSWSAYLMKKGCSKLFD